MGEIERIGDVLIAAERRRTAIGPVSELIPGGLDLELAHAICERNIGLRLAAGDRIAGYKIGFTNIPARDSQGLPDSTYGYVLESTVLPGGAVLRMDEFIAPRIETEMCFRLGRDLSGDGLTVEQVLDATEAVCATFEICDARIRDWKCPYPDFFADNSFSARVVESGRWVPPSEVDVERETVTLVRDGVTIAEGGAWNAMGHPAIAVAWLAAKLARRGKAIAKGQIVMTGSLTAVLPVSAGAKYAGEFAALGRVEASFV